MLRHKDALALASVLAPFLPRSDGKLAPDRAEVEVSDDVKQVGRPNLSTSVFGLIQKLKLKGLTANRQTVVEAAGQMGHPIEPEENRLPLSIAQQIYESL